MPGPQNPSAYANDASDEKISNDKRPAPYAAKPWPHAKKSMPTEVKIPVAAESQSPKSPSADERKFRKNCKR